MPQEQSQEPKEPETAEEYIQFAKELLGEADASKSGTPPNTEPVGYREQVNLLLKEVTVDEAGKFVYPDNTPEHLKYAVATEKKFRDTQGGFTKSQMSLKGVEAENEELRKQLSKTSVRTMEIPADRVEELEELKFSDPDAWFIEMKSLTDAHSVEQSDRLNKTMGEVRSKASEDHEVGRRLEVLKRFNEGRKTPVTLDILDNDIPPRISSRLAKGHLTFEGYLAEVEEFLGKGRVVSNPDSGSGTSLSGGAGSHTPPAEAKQLESGALDYSNVTF